jgi:hypothetical protein
MILTSACTATVRRVRQGPGKRSLIVMLAEGGDRTTHFVHGEDIREPVVPADALSPQCQPVAWRRMEIEHRDSILGDSQRGRGELPLVLEMEEAAADLLFGRSASPRRCRAEQRPPKLLPLCRPLLPSFIVIASGSIIVPTPARLAKPVEDISRCHIFTTSIAIPSNFCNRVP